MSDSLLDIGSFPRFPLPVDWGRQSPGIRAILARKLMHFPGTADYLKTFTDDAPEIIRMGVTLHREDDWYELIDFFNTVKGRHGRFWLKSPTLEYTVKGTASSGSTLVSVYRNGAIDTFRGYERVWFDMADGDILTRHIADLTENEAEDRYILSLESPLDREVRPDNCLSINRYLLGRFERDGLGFDIATDKVQTISFNFIELVQEYVEI